MGIAFNIYQMKIKQTLRKTVALFIWDIKQKNLIII